MKKLLALFLTFCTFFSIAGCGIDKETLNIIGDVVEIAGDIADEINSADDTDESMGSENSGSNSQETEHAGEIYGIGNQNDTEIASDTSGNRPAEREDKQLSSSISEDGTYTTADDVALYIHLYGKLPQNFITKAEARELGWQGGGLEDLAPGKCIGGDRFGNYDELLPEKDGRKYTECDIDTLGKDNRGAKRMVFSNDGLIFYTDDHYVSFTQLYDENGICY